MKVVAVFDIPDGMIVKKDERARLLVSNSRGDGIVHAVAFPISEEFAEKISNIKKTIQNLTLQ